MQGSTVRRIVLAYLQVADLLQAMRLSSLIVRTTTSKDHQVPGREFLQSGML